MRDAKHTRPITRSMKSRPPKHGTLRELSSLGLEDTAYVKAVMVDGQKLHAIHAADGTPLTVVAERELAFATVLQHEMMPASVH